MRLVFELLTEKEIERVHEASLAVLSKTGMRIESEELLTGLRKIGARVNDSTKTVLFPERIVEGTIENNRRLLKSGKKLHLLNGVTSEITGRSYIEAKISGGCEKYLDWDSQSLQDPGEQELLNYVRIGEKIPEVGFVGNPVVLSRDENGKRVDEKLRRVKTAALIAKNTRKIGSMEVWDKRELDYLVEIGIIARGGKEEYYKNPCLVTAKETISPLFLDEHAGNILLALAKMELPCTIIPMPITGISAPVTKLGNAIIGNAEILGVMTAIKSVCPESPVGGGTISGIIDMQTSVVSFSAPEAILQDIAIAEVHKKLYKFNYLIGSGYCDAKYPNSQVLAEKVMKYLLTFLSGRYSYPVGLINSGSVFSIEQALVDVELCRYIHAHFGGAGESTMVPELVQLIGEVGIRGHFIAENHTLEHFRENWFPQIMDRTGYTSIKQSKQKDMYSAAHEKVREMINSGDFWEIDDSRAKEIDAVVDKAQKYL